MVHGCEFQQKVSTYMFNIIIYQVHRCIKNLCLYIITHFLNDFFIYKISTFCNLYKLNLNKTTSHIPLIEKNIKGSLEYMDNLVGVQSSSVCVSQIKY